MSELGRFGEIPRVCPKCGGGGALGQFGLRYAGRVTLPGGSQPEALEATCATCGWSAGYFCCADSGVS